MELPNVLVLLLDDIGRDKISVYGDHPSPAPTPNIDALAARGVLFRNAWSYSTCSPTRAAVLTGRYSDRTGIGEVIRVSDSAYQPLALSEHILPEDLTGYHTAALGKWHLSDSGDGPLHPIDSGFDSFYGTSGGTSYFDWVENINGTLTPRSGYYPAALGGQAIRTLQGIQEPFFVYYNPRLAHSPFHAPPSAFHSQPTQPTDLHNQHRAMTEAIDAVIGRVLAQVDLTKTYVFVIGDNGSPGSTVTAPFSFGQCKNSLFEGGLRIPFIVAGPDVAVGQECDALVHVVDLFATIREVIGLGAPTVGAEDSVSFAPLLRDPSASGARSYLYVHRFPPPGVLNVTERAIRTRRWKLHDSETTGRIQLYDLETDPFETDDLLISQPGPVTDALRDRLLALMPQFP